LKSGLRRPITLIHEAATGASARSIARVHTKHSNARKRSLVANLLLEAEKRPAIQRGPLVAMPNHCPVANAVELFERDGAAGALGLGQDAFADAMVYVAGKERFTQSALAQQTFGGLGAFALQSGSQPPMAVAQRIELGTAEGLTIGVGGDIDDAEVYAEDAL